MKINDMFIKEISRPIQGVVKVGQDTNEIITTELSEYVVTKELQEHFKTFFNAYQKGTKQNTDKMGVWISGFFGSGKSHFLKILSYLLGERLYGGNKAISFFEGKIADGFVMADMQVATDTNADIILFNIDAETDSSTKTGKDPIVKVFMKMFNKMQGFCASMPWMADLERQMVERGVYDDFKKHFNEIANAEWNDAREDFYFEQDNIIKALEASKAMSKEAAVAWCNRSEGEYSLDISTFARRVREYIEAKEKQTGKKQFIIFLCDEVGQYIGSSGPLMLNLQNIVEGLGTECGGRAWVICTGQEDIDLISKNLDRDAFSKIIGRFDTRLKLSSANVDEVIKKRLLDKKDGARDRLHLSYEDKHSVIKNLITFSQGKQEMQIYESADNFIDVYPFIPYQFKLLQEVFNGIRTHGASGKHLSEGERSLLNAFQEAAMQFADSEDGTLIPFNAFYKTVETFLDHNIRKVILDAKDSADRGAALTAFDVEVLKVLFMIKYIADKFSPNLENITTLMLNHVDQVRLDTKNQLNESFRRLEEQRFVIRNGDQYIFLTNEEQDINREITDIRIDPSTLVDEASKLIFSTIFGLDRKFRYNASHDFTFNAYVDDKSLGNQKEEMGIRVISPYYSGNSDETAISLRSGKENNVLVVLPSNADFIEELKQSMQIDEFIRRGKDRIFTDTAETIVATKRREGTQRLDRYKDLIIEALKRADIFVNGNKLNIREKAPKERLYDALTDLVDIIYKKLNYIKEPFLTVKALEDIFKTKMVHATTHDGSENKDPNHHALDELYDVIAKSTALNITNTVRSISERFGKAPYAWKKYDIAGIMLTLFKEQKIRFELSGENITTLDTNVINYCIKREYTDRLVVKIRDTVSPHLLAMAKDIARDVFAKSGLPIDEDGIMKEIRAIITAELTGNDGDSIKDLLAEYTKGIPYPGKTVLDGGKKVLERVIQIKDTKSFFEALQTEKEEMIDYAQDVTDIKKFFAGTQRPIFDKAIELLAIYEGSRTYVVDEETIGFVNDIERIVKSRSPYSEIQNLTGLRDKFMASYLKILEEECKPIRAIIENDMAYTLADLEKRPFKDKFKSEVQNAFEALIKRLDSSNKIFNALVLKEDSDRIKLRFIQMFIDETAKLARAQNPTGEIPKETRKPTKTVSIKQLISGTSQIESKADIDRLLDDLRVKLEKELSDDTTIRIV